MERFLDVDRFPGTDPTAGMERFPGVDRAPGGVGAPGGAGGGARSPVGGRTFRALFEHAPLGVALSELDGSFTDVNRTLRELLAGTGIDPDTGGLGDLGRHLPDGSDEARAWRDGLAAILAGRAPVARAELAIAPPDAAPRWVQATTALVVLDEHRYLLSHLEDTTGRRLTEQRLTRLAMHDDLTGLANRALLADRFAAALAGEATSGRRTGVLYLDLDDFKGVNDRWGHAAGDRVLVAVAGRITHLLRAGDTAGRVGGDEFLVIAPDVADGTALAELARRLDAALAEPPDDEYLRLLAGVSIGATLAAPGDTLDTAMGRADRAMFDVKHRRHGGPRTGPDDVPEVDLRGTDPGAGPDPGRNAGRNAGLRVDLREDSGEGEPRREPDLREPW